MLVITYRFIRTVYPVLKESLLGKQSLLMALKTSKIKVLTLVYCMLSPFALSYLSNKTVSLASANVALNKKIVIMSAVLDTAFAATPPAAPPTIVTAVLPSIVLASAPPIKPLASAPLVIAPSSRRVIAHRPAPLEEESNNVEELLNRNHEHY